MHLVDMNFIASLNTLTNRKHNGDFANHNKYELVIPECRYNKDVSCVNNINHYSTNNETELIQKYKNKPVTSSQMVKLKSGHYSANGSECSNQDTLNTDDHTAQSEFNMAFSRFKQDENAHWLWLTIVPQIIVSTLYATNLAGVDTTVPAELLSSIASAVLALPSAYLEYPKKYFIYQMGIQLKSLHNTQVRKRLKMRRTYTLSNIVCESMERKQVFVFIENVYCDAKILFVLMLCQMNQ